MIRVYEALLWLYPSECRELFAREMTRVFEQAADEYRARGVASRFRFLCSEFAGLIAGAFGEWRRVPARRTPPLALPVALTAIAGLAAAAFFQAPVYIGLAQPLPTPPQSRIPQSPELAELLVGLAIAVGLLGFALAWNLQRVIRSSREACLRRNTAQDCRMARASSRR